RWPRLASAGSPGTSCVRTNATKVIPTASTSRATSRRPTKKTTGCRERNLASTAPDPRPSGGPDSGHVEEPGRVVGEVREVAGPGHDLARLEHREERPVLVHRALDLLVELLSKRVVGSAARLGPELLQRGVGSRHPARPLGDQAAGQEAQVV